jgi:hypothetical protein
MNNKFNSFLSKRNKIENFVSLLEVAASRGISGYVFVRNILRPVLENKNWNNLNQFVNIISRKLNNLNEAIIDPADPGKIITRKTFTPEDQKRRMKLHDELFNTVKEELKKHIKEAQYKAGYFLRATEKHDDPGEKAKARTTISMLDHLTKVINNHIDNYKLKYKTEFTDEEYNAELAKRAALSGDYEKGADSIISQFTREKLGVKHVSFAALLNKLTDGRNRMNDRQKLKFSFTVDQLVKDASIESIHKEKLKKLAALLPPPPENRDELIAGLADIKAREGGGRRIAWYSDTTMDMITVRGTTVATDDALDAVVVAALDRPVDITKDVKIEITPEKKPEPDNLEAKIVVNEPVKSLTDDNDDPDWSNMKVDIVRSLPDLSATPTTKVVNPDVDPDVNPGPIKKNKHKSKKQKETLTPDERTYYNSILSKNKKGSFLDATPEQRREMMNNDPIQRSLFPSSSPTDSDNITDWTKNNIGTFKQFIERFYR